MSSDMIPKDIVEVVPVIEEYPFGETISIVWQPPIFYDQQLQVYFEYQALRQVRSDERRQAQCVYKTKQALISKINERQEDMLHMFSLSPSVLERVRQAKGEGYLAELAAWRARLTERFQVAYANLEHFSGPERETLQNTGLYDISPGLQKDISIRVDTLASGEREYLSPNQTVRKGDIAYSYYSMDGLFLRQTTKEIPMGWYDNGIELCKALFFCEEIDEEQYIAAMREITYVSPPNPPIEKMLVPEVSVSQKPSAFSPSHEQRSMILAGLLIAALLILIYALLSSEYAEKYTELRSLVAALEIAVLLLFFYIHRKLK